MFEIDKRLSTSMATALSHLDHTTAASGLLYPLPSPTHKNPHIIRESNKNEEDYLFCNFNRPCKKTTSNKRLFLVITIKPLKTSFKLAAP